MKHFLAVLFSIAAMGILHAQTQTFPVNGTADRRHTIFAFTNAHIQVDPETVIDKGTMLVQDGMILQIGATVTVPKGAVVYDLNGKWLYPSFIDSYTTYGMPEVRRTPWSPEPQYES